MCNANFPASRRHFRLKMNCHGFPKAGDREYLFDHRLDGFDHRLDRFDHRLSKRCSALGCINALADWSTFKSAAGTIPNAHPHSRACIESNTHTYADCEPDTISKPSTCRNASPTFTPPQIALHPVRVIRVYDAAGSVIKKREHTGDFIAPYSYRLGSQLYRKPYTSAQCVRVAGDCSTLTTIK